MTEFILTDIRKIIKLQLWGGPVNYNLVLCRYLLSLSSSKVQRKKTVFLDDGSKLNDFYVLLILLTH